MNNIIKKGIIFILVFIPTLICAQDKLYNQQKDIVLSKEGINLNRKRLFQTYMNPMR